MSLMWSKLTSRLTVTTLSYVVKRLEIQRFLDNYTST